ncbi:P-loop containing nucleoside triphosphate hydrolase protein [Xylariomycetidae sp. FL0641]|nr:P-loop containing nucleoside triphosphate hydrolase protein [Xylariomycetidae sp. FL0641]
MKKFGFGKKSSDGKGSPASDNPYAQAPPGNDPYMNDGGVQTTRHAYAQARAGLPNGPRAGGLPGGPGPKSGYGAPPLNRAGSSSSSATAPPPYSDNQTPGGYGNDRYGASSGYGGSKYSSAGGYGGGSSSGGRQGGYGGLGPAADDDAQRDALFSGARQRAEQRQTTGEPGSGAYGEPGADDGSKYGGYGEQRELTEEEKDYEGYKDAKKQIKETTKASLATNQNSLRYMNQALDSGLSTYARLGAQNERLHHTDQLLDTATESHRHAEAQTKKLKSLNRSMFAVHVNNPFTEKRRTAQEEARIMSQNANDREIREASRRDKFQQNQRMENNFAGLTKDEAPSSFTRANRGDRSKYTLEDDSDEEGARELDEDNEQIERDLEQMSLGVNKLKRIGQAMGDELDHSNKLIDRIGQKTDPLDDQIRPRDEIALASVNTVRPKFSTLPKFTATHHLQHTTCNTAHSTMGEDEHRPKRRKTKATNDPNVVRIGDKVISLSAYLQPQQRTPAAEQTPARAAKEERDSPMLKARKALPIWAYRDQIQASLRKDNDILLVVGETGSGKSTQTPQFLCHEPWCQKKKVRVRSDTVNVGGMIAITQPRRVAATTLAGRVAREMGTPLGDAREGSVGYSVRFDHKVPKGTKIKFLTEGMLLQELLRDPNLRQYSAIIVDEIHERSVDVDLIAGFLKQILSSDKAGRGGVPLKVVIMSATADVEKIQQFFDPEETHSSMELLRIKGRQYPVDIQHTDKPVPDIQEALLKQIFKIHVQEPLPGDILAFLTGQEEIESAQRLIEEYSATLASDVPKLLVYPLYGQLSIQAQQDAFQPIKKGFARKVVLATNIAETSVTVPGVRYVIDCGKAKVKQFRSRLGMESLLAKAISQSSAIQRAGRAGREGPGRCYRLYTAATYATLAPADPPEILRNDVLGAVLTMKARGVADVLAFPLPDRPDPDAVGKALLHLHFLGAISDDGSITEVGHQLALLPVSPPYGRVLLSAAEPQNACLREAIDVVACVTAGETVFQQLHRLPDEKQQDEEKDHDAELTAVEDARKDLYRREGDILTYLTTLQRYAAEPPSRRSAWCRARRLHARTLRQALAIRRQLRALFTSKTFASAASAVDWEDEKEGDGHFEPLSPARAETLLRCFLRGFATRTALLAPDASYVTVQGKHVVAVHPSSVLHVRAGAGGQGKVEAIMFLEYVFTQRNYAKKVSAVRADWIVEAMGGG